MAREWSVLRHSLEEKEKVRIPDEGVTDAGVDLKVSTSVSRKPRLIQPSRTTLRNHEVSWMRIRTSFGCKFVQQEEAEEEDQNIYSSELK
eukprot:12402041-Karenia_brevis.AAC.1